MIIERLPLFNPSSSCWQIMTRTLNATTHEPISEWHMLPGNFNSKKAAETEIGRLGGPSEVRLKPRHKLNGADLIVRMYEDNRWVK